MTAETAQLLIDDILATITERFDESQADLKADAGDEFKSGRALAYREVKEIIETRLKTYQEIDA